MGKTLFFFATDVHGSDRCFRKFLNAAKAYSAELLILGGDLTGKTLIPIIEQGNGYRANYLGQDRVITEQEINDFEIMLKNSGIYYKRMSQAEHDDLKADESKREKLFARLMIERLEEWLQLAESRLGNSGIRLYLTGGNDDIMEVEDVLRKSNFVVAAEGDVVKIDDNHAMISSGYSNLTPWRCPRDIPDEELGNKIERMIEKVADIRSCIFNLHVPPFNSGLDMAPELDKDLRPVVGPGASPRMVPVGSTAVHQLIEKYQPLLGLHGHIHEARGFVRIGRTLCLNPGSEYGEGILRGALVSVDRKGIKQFMLTQG